MRSASGHTAERRSAQPEELSTWAPRARKGLPSTMREARPSSRARRGRSCAAASAVRSRVDADSRLRMRTGKGLRGVQEEIYRVGCVVGNYSPNEFGGIGTKVAMG